MSITVTTKEQMDLLTAVFLSLRATEEEAFIQADVLTEADLRGIHSHGLQRLPVLVKRIQNGLLKPNVDPEVTWTSQCVMSVDGKDGFGTAIAEKCLRTIAPFARKHGVAALSIRNTSHLGMLGYYCTHRAEEGLICIAFTSSEALVHPFGGAEALVGTNPIAIGFPCGPLPFVFDMATAVCSMGEVIASKHRGEKIPPGWAVDKDGNPTVDPEAALKGSLAPVGGPKGYGLGVCIGLLSGLLSGAEIGNAVLGTLDVEHRCTKGDMFLLLDPKAFPGGNSFESRVGDYLEVLRGCKPQMGFSHVAVAGDHGYAMREERLKDGIPHPEEVWHAAQRLVPFR
jgi:L-2-hydroxycarboxylate dehydrogenase (NAD+)